MGVNVPGWYKDPESGALQHVLHPAGADALARLGWKLIEDGPDPVREPEKANTFVAKHTGKKTPQADEPDSDEKDADDYKEVTMANGNKRYYKNGVQISAHAWADETGDAE